MGHSAGGHLASLLCTNLAYLEAAGAPTDGLKACVSVSGVYSDVRLRETGMGSKLLTNVFGDRKVYYDAFPIYNVKKTTVPFLLINAGLDIGLKRHTLDFHYALRHAGTYVRTEYFESLSHFTIARSWSLDSSKHPVLSTILDFIKEVQAADGESDEEQSGRGDAGVDRAAGPGSQRPKRGHAGPAGRGVPGAGQAGALLQGAVAPA